MTRSSGEFLVESYENLDRLDSQLLALEADPHETDAISGIFRTIHTIKGTCGFLGFSKLESVTHSGENLLGKLRDGVLGVGDEVMTALLGTGDAVRSMLASIEPRDWRGWRLQRPRGRARSVVRSDGGPRP